VRKPIMADRPVVGHPPPFVKVKRASVAVARGERTHSGTITAKNPIRWMIRVIPSTAGNLLARTVLNVTQNPVMAQTSKVPCHRSKTYVGAFKTIRPCMMVPTIKATDRRPACHPVIHNHPIMIGQDSRKVGGREFVYQLHNSRTSDTLAVQIPTPNDTDRLQKVPWIRSMGREYKTATDLHRRHLSHTGIGQPGTNQDHYVAPEQVRCAAVDGNE